MMKFVKISTDFYNIKEEEKFKKNYNLEYSLIHPDIGSSIEVPYIDFKTYFLFRHQFESKRGSRTFRDFYKKILKQWVYFEDYFKYDSSTKEFTSKHSNNNGNNEISDSLGVAGALVVSSTIFFGITQADWRKIPVKATKDFDFEHLSVFKDKFLVVEAKGSIVKNNRNSSSVAGHKRKILSKKESKYFKRKYNKSSNVCYGIITAAEKSKGLKAWMVDPPSDPIEMEARKYKLLSRLYFYHDYFNLISKRSYLSITLANRIKILEHAKNFDDFTGIPLISSNFEKISITASFINSRSLVIEKDIIGITNIFDLNNILFIGLNLELFNIIISQKFEEILNYKVENSTSYQAIVNCVIKKDSLNKETFNKLQEFKAFNTKDPIAKFQFKVDLETNSAGVTFGKSSFENIININEQPH